jgi:DNA-binding transcriptional LysR family regulator
MNLHLLRQFTAVVDEGGVVAAAQALNLSQPAVSRAVRQLELQMGVSLLERAGRRVRLTPEGAEIYAQARNIYAAERAAEETLAALKGLRHGVLRIGASTTIATYVLPRFIGRFARMYPQVELRLSAVHTRVIVDKLLQYELDVALAEAPVDDRAITVVPWRVDEMVVIAAPAHPLAGRRTLMPSDLNAELFVLRELESGTRAIVSKALKDAGVDVTRVMSVDGTEVIRRVVSEGLGIAVVSRIAVADDLAAGRLAILDVAGLKIQRPFNRLEISRRRPSMAAEAFLAMLQVSDTERGVARVPSGV